MKLRLAGAMLLFVAASPATSLANRPATPDDAQSVQAALQEPDTSTVDQSTADPQWFRLVDADGRVVVGYFEDVTVDSFDAVADSSRGDLGKRCGDIGVPFDVARDLDGACQATRGQVVIATTTGAFKRPSKLGWDHGEAFTGLRWDNWGRQKTVAHGSITFTSGATKRAGVTVTLSRLVECGDDSGVFTTVYRKIEIKYRKRGPSGKIHSVRETAGLGCY